MRTAIYVDGFNLYHSLLERQPAYKWLDLHAMAAGALQAHNQIVRIRYFTARVSARPTDPGLPQRQDTYLRALQAHVPDLTVHLGHFTQQPKMRRLVHPPPGGPKVAEIWHREEKGSDVNLAVHLLNDAWSDAFECAVVVSNDSDLAEAMHLARVRGKVVGLLSTARRPTFDLRRNADFFRHLTDTHLRNSQMPDSVRGPGGQLIHRPRMWR